MKRIILALATSLLFASSASAAVVPVFDWVIARTDSLLGLISSSAQVYDVVEDADTGMLYMVSSFSGTPDFNPGAGTDSIASLGGNDIFVSKFSSEGSYQWTKTWGGTGAEHALGAAAAGGEAVYVGGYFTGTVDFDPGAGVTNATAFSGRDVALSKLDADGNFVWVKTWGYTSNDSQPAGITVGSDGSVYVLGSFSGAIDFDPSVGIATSTSAGGTDIYLSKFLSDGTYQWTKRWGGTGADVPTRFVKDENSNLYIVGLFNSTVDFDPNAGAASSTSAGSYDVFALKLDSDGLYQWHATLGGTGIDTTSGLNRATDGSIYVSGYFNGTADFDSSPSTANLTSAGAADAYLLKLNSSGGYEWAQRWGGTGADASYAPVFSGDFVVVPGYFSGTVDFDSGVETDSMTSSGGWDIYLSTFDTDGAYYGVRKIGGALDEWTDGLVRRSGQDSLTFFGYYKSAPADFDPSSESSTASSNGTSMYLISFDLVEPSATVTTDDLTLREEASAADSTTYTIVLADAPPAHDVTVTITPDADLSVSTTSIVFASTTWDVAQTITVTAVDDEDIETTHEGTITHTATSDDGAFDGLSIASVTVTIADDDSRSSGSGGSSGGGGSRSSGISNAVQTITDQEPAPQPAEPAVENNPELIAELQVKITELKQQLIQLLTQKIKELQEQLAAMQ